MTREHDNAKQAGCRVAVDLPSKYVSDLRHERRWKCGCVYRVYVYPDGTTTSMPATRCTDTEETE